MRMVFLGPPAVGKGTHANSIARRMNLAVISIGETLREEAARGTELGKRAKVYMDRGELVPDETVVSILKEKLKKIKGKRGFILDGYPRTLRQAESLRKIAEIEFVVNFQLSRETLMKRMGNRITCRKCGKIYNLIFVPPKRKGICDDCGGELYQREDQKPDVVEQRLRVYEKETRPLVDFYKKSGILVDVDAEGSVDEVDDKLTAAITSYFKNKGR